jgi:peroxiredoxin Q/BCP
MAKKQASKKVSKKTPKKTSKKVAKPAAKKAASKPAAKAASKQAGLLEPGAPAPAFALPDQSGTQRSLADYAGKPLILYFYPKDDTEDCTTEACDFNDRAPALSKLGAAVLGVSRLDVKSKAKFASKHAISFPLLADEEGRVSAAYGTWVEKSMYGKKFMGVSRTTYLIDATGRIARRWDKVDVNGHAAEVAKALKAL